MKRTKYFLLLLAGICFCSMAIAQEVLYSRYEKFDFRNGDFSVVGKIGSKLYVYRSSNDRAYLDAYNDNMEWQATVMLDFFPRKIYETRFVTYRDRMIVLYQSIEKNNVVQYAALLDADGRLQKKVMLAVEKTGFFGPNRSYFSSAVSEDKEHIVVYSADDKDKALQFSGKWLNSNLEIEKSSAASFKADNDVIHGEGILTNDGTFYLPVSTPYGSKEFVDRIWLLALPHGGNKFAAQELPLDGKFGAGIYYRSDNAKGRIYIGGFYTDKKNGNYDGVLYSYYDLAGKTFENRKLIPFDSRLRAATGERNKKKALNNYQVRQITVKNDGGLVLSAEYFVVTTRNNYSPGYGYYSWYYPTMSASVREYHYEDILVMSYNTEGVQDWYTFIRKDQYSQEDGGLFSSFAYMSTGGALGYLFNDFNTSRSRIQLATVDGGGVLDMHSLAADKADDPDWLPRSGKQVAAREVVVPCLRRGQLCFAKIIF